MHHVACLDVELRAAAGTRPVGYGHKHAPKSMQGLPILMQDWSFCGLALAPEPA